MENPHIAINLLEKNLSSVSVQKHAFKLLLNFELSQTDKLEIINSGRIKVVIAGIEHHKSAFGIHVNACKVL